MQTISNTDSMNRAYRAAADKSAPQTFAKPGETQAAAVKRFMSTLKREKAIGRRTFPVFKPGMSTSEYVSLYEAFHSSQSGMKGRGHGFWSDLNCEPATLYAGESFDFAPIVEDVADDEPAPVAEYVRPDADCLFHPDPATLARLPVEGKQVATIEDAWHALEHARLFIAHDMDEHPMEVFHVSALNGYTVDQMIQLPRGEAPAPVAPIVAADPCPPVGEMVQDAAAYRVIGLRESHDEWVRNEARDFVPNGRQSAVIGAVQTALAEGLFYNSSVVPRCAELLAVGPDDRLIGAGKVVDGAFGMDVYYARQAIRAAAAHAAEDEAAARLAASPGMKLGALIFNDGKLVRAVVVTSVSDDGRSITFEGSRGRSKVAGTNSAASIERAMQRAAERSAERAERNNPAPVAVPEPIAPEPAHVEPEPVACTPAPAVGEKADAEETAMRLGHFEEMLRLIRERKVRELAAVGDLSDGGILRGDDGRRYVMVLPDVDGGGRWRIQRFDAQGFSGHEVFPGMLEAAAAAVSEGFKTRDDGALDALASRPEWARGMFVCDLAQRINGGMLDWHEANRLIEEYDRQHAAPTPSPAVVEMRNDAPVADDPAPDVAGAFTLAAEQLRDLASAIDAPGARPAARPIMARRWALGGIRRQRRALPPAWRGADAMRRPAARCGMAQAPPPVWGKCAPTANCNIERRTT